ncbi:uncharacterized protein TA12650 [Theileria annulata]|uniref:Uncharacterized protein n=1 Tax=Theileria annulata TaxID=5874 RepID=Q4UE46_THEAN|nr:uncharacterized protein TA12650 [Theileria annulata]CAI74643.1 hypothetical protein, conserved [Theileria annulata]|eukprot:XP_952375.1 hypothetical protein, conserved [Theileria annulata]
MPKYNIFPKLSFFSYIDKIHIRYMPGSAHDDTCRKLMLNLLDPSTSKRFPNLKYTYELLKYFNHFQLIIQLQREAVLYYFLQHIRFYADSHNLEDIHKEIDVYQYNGNFTFISLLFRTYKIY